MPVFVWKGEDRKGATRKGEIEAPDESTVRAQLRRMQIKSTKIKTKPKDLLENISILQPKVKTTDVVVYARQFATMINAGLPLIQSLDILQSQQENKTFKKMMKEIKENVEEGSTLTDALKKHSRVFDDLFVKSKLFVDENSIF